MGKLRSLHQDMPLEDAVVSADQSTKSVDIGQYEGLFSVQIDWTLGSGFSANVSLEVSNNNTSWVEIPTSITPISGVSGTHLFDSIETAAEYIRVKFSTVAGNATFDVSFNGKVRG